MKTEREVKDKIFLLENGLNSEMNEWIKEKVRLEINTLKQVLE